MSGRSCAVILGQGGWFTSAGIGVLGQRIAALGITTQVFEYQDWTAAEAFVRGRSAAGDKVAVVTYSLGGSTGTYLGTRDHIDLLICIFLSSLAQNYPVGPNVTDSVLFIGQDFLSDANPGGFKEVIPVTVTPFTIPIADHLLGQDEPQVIDGILTRVAAM
jgi:hypothetical protein